ncbi:CDGSH iron-sulfur domain-containing protein [Shimia biformata]|uniref:CDGSH iron-sulfur domain-containing protein n=1 Tax=Shimia biformata TaxID=1294299 RepID=UPI00195008DC|nr:CDGSH iron-sulfur domain-containing protein [Shimia biformata]
MTEKPTIEERENGPLVVKGLTRLIGPDGTEYETKPVMALCRCGHSKNKPFCDGSHNDAGFKSRGGTPAGIDRVLVYEGADVSVSFNPRLCAHAAECARIAPTVFDASRKPWVQPNNGSVDDIREVIAACPSGALAIVTESGPQHLGKNGPQIEVMDDGPYCVSGVEHPAQAPGEAAAKTKFVLCRCGLSGNKPYCDGTHHDKGWTAD